MSSSQQDELKKQAAIAAIDHIKPQLEYDSIIGVGTGSTVRFFIEALAGIKGNFRAAVSSSDDSTEKLTALGIQVIDLNDVNELEFYIDGADEANSNLHLIKGGGGALTREKVIAAVARKFICIIDASKNVPVLGEFPLPVEVIPMARSHVARKLVGLGGSPEYREGIVTDNGNHILDVHNLKISNPVDLETKINNIPGVVTNGLFAQRPADILISANATGIEKKLRT